MNKSCIFRHDNIEMLFGVEPAPIDQLPAQCVCGSKITYAAQVAFVKMPAFEPYSDGAVTITEVPIKWETFDIGESK